MPWHNQETKYMEASAYTPVTRLEAGVYKYETPRMSPPYLEKIPANTDNLFVLPGTEMAGIAERIRRFWTKQAAYTKAGLLFKRGVLMYGPPGCGKTGLVGLLIKEHLANDGIVLYGDSIAHYRDGLALIRQQESDRRILVVMEDVDRWMDVEYDDDAGLTHLLDGQSQINNVCYLATTNHLEEIPKRVTNRPSRFDEVLEIGLPTQEARTAYLASIADGLDLTPQDVEQFGAASAGMSLAHLKELAVAVKILEVPLATSVARLVAMNGSEVAADSAGGPGIATKGGF